MRPAAATVSAIAGAQTRRATSGTSGTIQITYWGESTLPKATNATTAAADAVSIEAVLRGPRQNHQAARAIAASWTASEANATTEAVDPAMSFDSPASTVVS